jgi:hypothetical protein
MKTFLLAVTLAILATNAPVDAASATASIGVTILGTGGADPASSAVTLSAARSFVDDGHGAVAGSFSVAGARRAAYAVVVPSEVRATGARGELVVRPAEMGARFLPESGRGEMSLGFRLDPSDRPAAGSYAGTVAVTLAYN